MPVDPNAPELKRSWRAYQSVLRRCIAYSWLAGALVLVSTVYMFEVYDRVVNSRNLTTLVMLTVLVLGAYAVMEWLTWVRQESLRAAARAWELGLRARVYDVAQRMARQGLAGAGAQVAADQRTLRDAALSPLVGALMEAPLSLLFLLILFAFHPWLGWATLLGAVAQVGLTGWNEARSRAGLIAANRSAALAQARADEVLRHHEVVSAMGLHEALRGRWAQMQTGLVDAQAGASLFAGQSQALNKWLQTLMGSLLLGLSAYLLLQDSLPGGGGLMIVASVLGGRVLAPLAVVMTQWRMLAQARQANVRLGEALLKFPAIDAGMPLPPPRGQLSVEGLTLAPPQGGVPVVRDVRLSVPPGQCLAVLGPSGAGKSSLLRALVGAWAGVQGRVRLDGVDVAQWDKAELGRHIGYMPQELGLLEGTVAQNLSRFEAPRDAHEANCHAALTQVGLSEALAAWPDGVRTAIGPGGAQLSGGQRQRLALARVLWGGPRLVVLDEPTAHLDEAGETMVLRILASLKAQGATVVFATHRTSLLGAADQLLLLRDGQAQAYGPRDQVLQALREAAAKAKRGGA
jgi:ATP-binding cassette subfamily C exporter for protease/lipase